MAQSPVYLFFTSWVQMRQVMRDRRLHPGDCYLASGDHQRWIKVAERRIVFVRSDYQAEGRDFERWYDNAALARMRNADNDYEMEILNV